MSPFHTFQRTRFALYHFHPHHYISFLSIYQQDHFRFAVRCMQDTNYELCNGSKYVQLRHTQKKPTVIAQEQARQSETILRI